MNVLLPELGEGIQRAVVACWHVHEGQAIKKDDDIVELVTDKASFNVSAEGQGKIKRILVKEGQTANIGDILAVIEYD